MGWKSALREGFHESRRIIDKPWRETMFVAERCSAKLATDQMDLIGLVSI
jgi:hypothetical protein